MKEYLSAKDRLWPEEPQGGGREEMEGHIFEVQAPAEGEHRGTGHGGARDTHGHRPCG